MRIGVGYGTQVSAPPVAGAERALGPAGTGAGAGTAGQAPAAVLSARRLTKSYGGDVVLRDVDLHIGAGEVVGLIGATGRKRKTETGAAEGQPELFPAEPDGE